MMELLGWVENLRLSKWVVESVALYAFPGIIALHAFGLAFCVGISTAINMRVLGVASNIPLQPLKGFMPALWAGFWVNAFSGLLLFMAQATKLAVNPLFLGKMFFVILAIIVVVLINRELFSPGASPNEASKKAKRLAAVCLAFWTLAIIFGRLVAYIDVVKSWFTGEGA